MDSSGSQQHFSNLPSGMREVSDGAPVPLVPTLPIVCLSLITPLTWVEGRKAMVWIVVLSVVRSFVFR